MKVVHGRYADATVVPVDPADLALHFDAESLVVLDPLAARRGHLNHHRLRYRESVFRQKFPVRLEALLDALGVVEAVDAEDDRLRIAELGADLLGPGPYQWARGQPLDLGHVDGDGERG